MDYIRTIQELHDAGVVVVPVRTDGSKRPALNNWKQYQTDPPSWDDVLAWFNQPTAPGVGVLTGAVSGNLEMAEIEGRGIVELAKIRAYAEAVGAGELWLKATTGWLEQSPSGGLHWFYYTQEPTAGNTKLARRPATPEELAVNPRDKVKVLTETRGEGGFVVVAPSAGTVHETGQPWVRLLGGPATAPTLTADELADFHRMLSIIDSMPAAAPTPASQPADNFGAQATAGGSDFGGVSPLDHFEAETDWQDILVPAGWSFVWKDSSGTSYWRRPGKDSGQASATTGHADDRDRMFVFSTSTDLPDNEPMTKQFVYSQLNHKGDISKAASALRKKGFGSEPAVPAPAPRDAPRPNTQQAPSNPAEGHTATWTSTAEQPITSTTSVPAAAAAAGTSSFNTVPGSDPAPANNAAAPGPFSVGNLATVTQLTDHEPRPALELITRTFEYSDDGNALRLIDRYADQLRYCPDRGKWMTWNGTRWQWQPKGGGEARELAKDVARAMPETNADARKHKRYSLQAMGISNMLIQASTDSRITVDTEQLDAHPWELNTPGGIIDLRTGQLMPSDPNKLHTRSTSCTPDPGADQALLRKFLDDTFPDNPALQTYMQRLLGYSAIGEVLAHVLPFAFGGGGNGKGVLFEMVGTVLGDYATSTPEGFLMKQQFQNHSTEIAKLSGARFVVCAEVNEEDKFDEAKVKLLTGGDRLTARFMRQDEFTFKPTHHLWLSGNYQPKVESGGASFWRRLRQIPFVHSVPEDKVIEGLADVLGTQHGPAVLQWIAQGAADFHRFGLQEPDDVRQATKDYSLSVDTVARFLEDECIVGDRAHNMTTRISALTSSYQRWCAEQGEKALDGRALSNQLSKHGVLVGRDAPRSSSGRMYGRIGLVDHRDEQESSRDEPERLY